MPSFVDATALVIQFLDVRHPEPVYGRTPATPPVKRIEVGRVGGAAKNRVVDKPQILIRACAGSDADAESLANDIRQNMYDMAAESPRVRRVEELAGPYRSTQDAQPGKSQYSLSFILTVRASR